MPARVGSGNTNSTIIKQANHSLMCGIAQAKTVTESIKEERSMLAHND